MSVKSKIFYALSMVFMNGIVYAVAQSFNMPTEQLASMVGLSVVQTFLTAKILLGLA